MFLKATGKDPADIDRKDVDEFRAAHRSAGAAPASWARCWRNFPRASRTNRAPATTSRGCSHAFREYEVAIELRHRSFSDDPAETMDLLAEHGAALVQIDEPQVQDLDPPEPARQREDLLLPAAARPQRGAMVEARQVRGPLQLPLFARWSSTRSSRRRKTRRASVKKAYCLRQQPLLREVGRQRRDHQGQARTETRRRIPGGVRAALPGPEGPGEDPARYSFR